MGASPPFTAGDVVALTQSLVAIPSVSGDEHAVMDFIEAGLAGLGLSPTRSGRNVWVAVAGRPGPRTLLLEAHMDTVPSSEQWTRNPWDAARADGRIHGLGSNDTKGGGAAMICALAELARTRDFDGTLLFAATCDEETGGQGLEVLRPELPPITGAVIAEPTTLRVATCQRGLMRVVVACEGKSAHAARPWQGVNAIELALADIGRLATIEAPDAHPLLGPATLTPTMIEGGVKANVVPPVCRYTLDGRPTPEYPNAWWEDQIRATVSGTIEVFRARMTPCDTSVDDPLVVAALHATRQSVDGGEPYGFGGVSDLWHVRDVAGVVLGPGRPEQSHQADEWVEESQVLRAVDVYRDLCAAYLTKYATTTTTGSDA
jgi:acetylornithine deacetylase